MGKGVTHNGTPHITARLEREPLFQERGNFSEAGQKRVILREGGLQYSLIYINTVVVVGRVDMWITCVFIQIYWIFNVDKAVDKAVDKKSKNVDSLNIEQNKDLSTGLSTLNVDNFISKNLKKGARKANFFQKKKYLETKVFFG